MTERFKILNLGSLGTYGESMFSMYGQKFASDLIEKGWVPCGTTINGSNEVLQSFYLPFTEVRHDQP